jgi:uncharacterized membrane protein
MAADKLRRLSRETSEALDVGMRDLQNRGLGLMHDAEALLHVGPHSGAPVSTHGRFKWSPGPRLLAAGGGTALMAKCAMSRSLTSKLLGTLGFGLFLRSLAGKADVHVERTIQINAPRDQVFEFFANPENYRQISDMITSVELLGDGRFAKSISMAGIPVRFEERFTCCDKNRGIEPRSTERSPIQYSKQLRFEPVDEHHTRLHMHFCYRPPLGELGHWFASWMGLDAQTLLNNLLLGVKCFLETGSATHQAQGRHRHGVSGHNGSHRNGGQTSRGSNAPLEHMAGSSRFSTEDLWPRADVGAPHPGVPMPFPPVVD